MVYLNEERMVTLINDTETVIYIKKNKIGIPISH